MRLSEQRVCGSFRAEDPWKTIEGEFSAPIDPTALGLLARAGR